jgi:hypothetical protein
MKKIPICAVTLFLLSACGLIFLCAQEKPGESVTVTAIEVPVRVLDAKQFISGLGRNDFEIYENGVRQEITGFEEVSRTISPDPIALPGQASMALPRRNFVLIFNIFDYTKQVGEAVDYFFGNIYKPGDRLFVLVEDRLLDVGSGPEAGDLAANLKDVLLKLKRISGFEFFRMFREVEREAGNLYFVMSQRPPGDKNDNIWNDIKRFYFRYGKIWEDYRRRLLDIDLDLYRVVVKKVARLTGEKWAICFQQRNMFPVLKSQGRLDSEIEKLVGEVIEPQWQVRARDIQADAEALLRSFNITKAFPGEALRDLFTGANITFHVLVLKSLSRMSGNDSQDLDLQDVQGEYEDTLRRISRSTGGLTAFSNEVLETLKKAAAKEDRYYKLAYQPKDKRDGLERKIDVQVHRAGAEVIALKRFVSSEAPSIEISGFQSRGKRIGFDVGKYGRSVRNWKEVGQVMIKITVFDDESHKVFEESKGLEFGKDRGHIDLEFSKLQPGSHFIIIEAVDIVTGGKDVFSRSIVL